MSLLDKYIEREYGRSDTGAPDDDRAREIRKGCTICGLAKGLHFYKSHPYSPQRKKATYELDSLGINTDAVVGIDETTIIDRVQAEGREMFRRGVVIEDYDERGAVRVRLRVHDEDYSHDIDLGDLRPSGLPPGRAIIEPFTGRGLVGENPDPNKRIYIVENPDWPALFAHVVQLSDHARIRSPLLRVGQRVIIERNESEKFHIRTSGDYTALFAVIHVDDICAIA